MWDVSTDVLRDWSKVTLFCFSWYAGLGVLSTLDKLLKKIISNQKSIQFSIEVSNTGEVSHHSWYFLRLPLITFCPSCSSERNVIEISFFVFFFFLQFWQIAFSSQIETKNKTVLEYFYRILYCRRWNRRLMLKLKLSLSLTSNQHWNECFL